MASGNSWRFLARALRVLAAVAALVALGAPAALAQCIWKMPYPFDVYQDNGYEVRFQLTQTGEQLSGYAAYDVRSGGTALTSGTVQRVIGNVSGSISGDRLYMTVHWSLSGVNSVGVYSARVENGYFKDGVTRDEKQTPITNTGWRTAHALACTGSVPALPPIEAERVAPRVVKKLGKLPGAFGGQWVTVANGGAWSFDMRFTQDGSAITGTYVVRETGVTGAISGTVSGGTLNFDWADQGGGQYAGTGRLRLASDGASFDGTYAVTYVPPGLSVDQTQGTWHGRRQ